MNDYRATESTLCGEAVAKEVTVKNSLQEANKILNDLAATLGELMITVCGKPADMERPSDVTCLAEESRKLAGLAYECLARANIIRETLI